MKIIGPDLKHDTEKLCTTLFSIEPFMPAIAYEMFKHSNGGLAIQLMDRFCSTQSIGKLFTGLQSINRLRDLIDSDQDEYQESELFDYGEFLDYDPDDEMTEDRNTILFRELKAYNISFYEQSKLNALEIRNLCRKAITSASVMVHDGGLIYYLSLSTCSVIISKQIRQDHWGLWNAELRWHFSTSI